MVYLFAVFAASLPAFAATLPHVADEIVVQYKKQVSAAQSARLLKSFSLSIKEAKPSGRRHVVKLKNSEQLVQLIDELKQRPEVEYAEPNYIYRKLALADDSEFGNQWALRNTGQTINSSVGSAGQDINSEQAWELVTDCRDSVVAVIDSGVNYNHEDLLTNIWSNPNEAATGTDSDGNGYIDDIRGWDFVDNDDDPVDQDGHGSHIAGIIGAEGNDGQGTAGICWQASIMPIRVLDEAGVGTLAAIVEGIQYAIDNGARIINLSLGAYANSQVLASVLDEARQNDIVVVASAGNEANDNDITPVYPCSYAHANLVCVAALNNQYQMAAFSNSGVSTVDVAAPGVDIISEVAGTITNVFEDDFENGLANWNFSPQAWVEESNQFYYPGYTLSYMSDPSGFSGLYTANRNDSAFMSAGVDLSSAAYDDLTLHVNVDYDLGSGDSFRILFGDAATPSIPFFEISEDTTSARLQLLSFAIPSGCRVLDCRIGFNLETNNDTGLGFGVEIERVIIQGLTRNTFSYDYYSGTSMAAPHVAGIAAMVRSFRPDYDFQDTVNALKFSGDLITGLEASTVTARAVDAYRAITYINPPRNISVQVD
jgi:subtilisin family serine protease